MALTTPACQCCGLKKYLSILAAAFILFASAVAGHSANLDSSSYVFVIVMENHNWSSIKGSASAPYINNTLLPTASHAEQYYNPPGNHPSEPNYLWLEAGTNFGITNDNPPATNHQTTTAHLVTQLEAAGISWRTYQEGITGAGCPTTDNAPTGYYVRHNPFAFFDDVTGSADPTCTTVMRPFTELATDLANNTLAHYNFITPNICNDGHNSCAPTNNPVKQIDDWLSQNIPTILNSAAYQNDGLIIVTWDEGESSSDGPIGCIVLSPFAKGAGYSNTIHYTHSSTLRTLQKIFGVTPLLRGAGTITDLSDLFTANTIPNADSEVAIEEVSTSPANVTVTCSSQPGIQYELQWKNALIGEAWHSVTPDKPGNGGALSWTDDGTTTGSTPAGQRFYRVVIQ